MNKSLIMAFIAGALTGCTSTYKTSTLEFPSKKLNREYTVIVQTPQNGYYGAQEYKKSGLMTAKALKTGFLQYASNVNSVPNKTSKSDFKGIERHYYVRPEILEWEDRATEWSGKRDRISVKIEIYNTSTMERESSIILNGKSKWFTLGGDHPQDLLQKPVHDYIRTLY